MTDNTKNMDDGIYTLTDENGNEIELKDDEDDELAFGAGGSMNYAEEELPLYDATVGNQVAEDEAADAGFEIQDEEDVFGLLGDMTGGEDDSEND